MKELVELVIEWARERGILEQSTPQFQMIKACEENGEMMRAVLAGDGDAIADALGDQMVVAIIQCAQLNYVPEVFDWCTVPDYTYDVDRSATGLYVSAMNVTSQQGVVAASIARGRDAHGDFDNLFDDLFRMCHAYGFNPERVLRDVYNIISKRKGKMKDGVWVKESDL